MDWLIIILISSVVSISLTLCAIPIIIKIALEKHLYDPVDPRKIHNGIIPRLGGVAFLPSIFIAVSFALSIYILKFGEIADAAIWAPQILMGMCCAIILYFMGLADDLNGVRYRTKFIFQAICGVLMVYSGVWINNLYGIAGIHEIPIWIGGPLTVFTVVFMVNAINLIDGIDGLASGLSFMALIAFGVLFFMQGNYIYSLLSLSTAGVLMPFYRHNVFGDAEKGQKIFMGDTGSLTIGYIISMMAVRYSMSSDYLQYQNNAIVIAFTLMIIPMFDVIFVVFLRMRNKANPFKPDQNHIHHKFLTLGFSQRQVMIMLLTVSCLFSIANIILFPITPPMVLIFTNLAIWLTVYLLVHYKAEQKEKKAELISVSSADQQVSSVANDD